MNRGLKPALFAVFLLPWLSAGALDLQGGAGIRDYLNGIYGAEDYEDLSAFPLLKFPLGGRAEGMGSAFTAVADDSSFLESNPAGSSRLRHTELAFFHNRWITEIMGDTMVESLVLARGFGNLGLAAGGRWLSTPVTEYNAAGSRVSGTHYSEAEIILNGAWNFPLGQGFSGISAGASLKGAFRNVPGTDLSAASAMGDIGVLCSFDLFKFFQSPDWNSSVGLAFRNLGPPAGTEALPTLGALGLAYRPLRPLLVSFDFFLPFSLRTGEIPEKPYFATGLEFTCNDSLSLRGGLRVKSESLRLTLGGALKLYQGEGFRFPGGPEKTGGRPWALSLDLNYSMDPLFKSRSPHRLSLAFRLDLEDKKEAGGISRKEALYIEGLDAYGRSDYETARLRWQEALNLDPHFLPAAEALAMLEESRGTRSRMDAFMETEKTD
jgi:hypothetical protein